METKYETEFFAMGTVINQKVYGKNSEFACIQVENEIKRIENIMSFFLEDSDINKLNKNAGKSKIKLEEETIYVINKAKQLSKLSSGAFDITTGPLVKLWGVFTNHAKVPNKKEIDEAQKLIRYEDIIIDVKSNLAMLRRKGQMVDLGAIAKGYAADKAIEIYKKNGIKSAFINIGGNVMVLGKKNHGDLWTIGIQNPDKVRGECIGALLLEDASVVTSGGYVRYFEKNNIKYHHIMDFRTGYPCSSGLKSVTAISNKSIEADALSTAIFVLGYENGRKLVDNIDGLEAIFITENDEIKITEGLKDKFVLFECV
ncbi:thiamine biosynthesis lipoprotein [Clostridium acidisoli DSM 12555]|jgi:thiamine biosynthesis lipoprotein|uniref:FAD:protein FMN transferase n=1 Tax=Clostridium acidisoli DSM 12555 TaxID=1121291 RepID=A0A1W1XD37_9CLOT|nr:FAD:protein FMN transferase [Clostridium acidisoli]SMC21790.1 thiamine biosynthesis lipoprotein [Clostridium acidisoli DSM 12555]